MTARTSTPSETPWYLDPDYVREYVARSRAEQGLPLYIEDPATIERIVAIFMETDG